MAAIAVTSKARASSRANAGAVVFPSRDGIGQAAHHSTASQWQVRQPIYKGSVDAWAPYATWLAPMREAFGALVDAQGHPVSAA